MKARVEQNFSCSSQSLIKQIFAATSYSKIADVFFVLGSQDSNSHYTNMCIMLFFRKTNDLKVRENRRNSLEDNQIYNF